MTAGERVWVLVVIGIEAVAIIVLIIRVVRIESIVRGMLGGWKRGR